MRIDEAGSLALPDCLQVDLPIAVVTIRICNHMTAKDLDEMVHSARSLYICRCSERLCDAGGAPRRAVDALICHASTSSR